MIIYYTYTFNGDREESRRLLKLAFADYSGSDAEAETLMSRMTTCGNAGKPHIPDFAGFSVSHSGDAWAVLIACGSCGLDIQYPRKAGCKGIAERFYAPEDRSTVMEAFERSDKDSEEVFFRIWTRREALVKALGLSVASEGLPSVLRDCVQAGDTGYFIRDIRMPEAPDLYAAICTDREGGHLQFRELITG